MVVSAELYCPTQQDFDFGGDVQWDNNGWTMTGSGGVHAKTSWNLLGGFIEFEMDTSGSNAGVNTNLYTTSPDGTPGGDNYCDIQSNGHGGVCMEMDVIEANGNCAAAATVHTWPNKDGGCDQGGCGGVQHISGTYTVRAEFSEDGRMKVTYNGNEVSYHPQPSDAANKYVADTMRSTGATIESSQWVGWVPDAGACPGSGDLGSSRYSVRNLQVFGAVLKGQEPTKCGGPSPPPPGPSWYKTITPSSNTNLCLDLPGDDPSNGNSLWLWECNGAESQRWVFDNYQIRFGADESKCIDAGDMSNGLQMFLWDCNGYPQQSWGFDVDASRMYLTDTGTCLDFYGDWQSNGQPLHVWDCSGDWNQEWSLWNVGSSALRSAGNVTDVLVV